MISHADPRSRDRLSFAAERLRDGVNPVKDSQWRTVVAPPPPPPLSPPLIVLACVFARLPFLMAMFGLR